MRQILKFIEEEREIKCLERERDVRSECTKTWEAQMSRESLNASSLVNEPREKCRFEDFKEGFKFILRIFWTKLLLVIDHGVYDRSCLVTDHKPMTDHMLTFLNTAHVCWEWGPLLVYVLATSSGP